MTKLRERAFSLLLHQARCGETISYREFADKIGIEQAPVIAQVTTILERLIDEDIKNQRPILSALVVQKKGAVPRPGFFQKLCEAKVNAIELTGGAAMHWHKNELKKIETWVKNYEL